MSSLHRGDEDLHYSDNSHRWIAPADVDQEFWEAELAAHLDQHRATMGHRSAAQQPGKCRLRPAPTFPTVPARIIPPRRTGAPTPPATGVPARDGARVPAPVTRSTGGAGTRGGAPTGGRAPVPTGGRPAVPTGGRPAGPAARRAAGAAPRRS